MDCQRGGKIMWVWVAGVVLQAVGWILCGRGWGKWCGWVGLMVWVVVDLLPPAWVLRLWKKIIIIIIIVFIIF